MPLERQVLDYPITPSTLDRIDVMTSLPEASSFDPEKNWAHTYLVWTNHGYDKGNIDAGYLTIERQPISGGGVSLNVVTEIALLEGIGARTASRIACLSDALTTPVTWELDSTFTGPSGEDLPNQDTHQESRIADKRMSVYIDGRSSVTPIQEMTTGDWCLFDAVQRLPQDQSTHYDFDVLERMMVIKRDQTLWFSDRTDKAAGHNLRCFVRKGAAQLPTEYWLDEQNRLVLVVAYNMVYLLSDTAVETFKNKLAQQRDKA
ncbi:MAG TPA: hypothetical protein DHW45_08545 [Candidatus Latescibacteria bacterium]|jgi:hypothetical protein|nr:hypothetical protein [Candidatus Latescibacterota bacterium]